MSDQSPYIKTVEKRSSSRSSAARFESRSLKIKIAEPPTFQCPGESQSISQAVHLARLERCYPKCRQCPYREEVGPVSERRDRGIRTILSESEPIVPDCFVIAGREGEFADATRFRRWAAQFGLSLRHLDLQRFAEGRSPRVVLADASVGTVPDFVAAVSTGLRWAGCDVIDLGRGAVGLVQFAAKHLGADAGLLLAQPGQWEHECGLSIESVFDERLREDAEHPGKSAKVSEDPAEKAVEQEMAPLAEIDLLKALSEADDSSPVTDRPTRRLGQLQRVSLTERYQESFKCRYHGLRPLRIMLYTSCVPVVDSLRYLTAPFDVQLETLPYSVELRESEATDLFGAHFSVYIDGTGRVVELLDEQGVPFFADLDDLSPDAVEVVTAVQVLLSRSDASLSELTFKGLNLRKKSGF